MKNDDAAAVRRLQKSCLFILQVRPRDTTTTTVQEWISQWQSKARLDEKSAVRCDVVA